MSAQQREVFELLQKQREGFFFRYRDFGVRQRDLFLANYTVHVAGQTSIVAGRECTQLEVRRRRPAPTWYMADVDVESSLVLRWSEFTPTNQLVSRSEFLDFTLDPDLTGVDWFQSPLQQVEPLEPGHESVAILGFHPHQPQVLPAGYQLLRSEMVREHDVKWLRRVYGDGVENLFVLEHGSATPKIVVAGPAPTILVRLCQVGAWTLAEVVREADQFFVVGKVGEDEVVSCLRSAF